MDVELPNGQVIQDVPEGMTKAQLLERLKANGIEPGEAPPSAWSKIGHEAAMTLPSLGTGLIRGGVSTALLPNDIMAAVNPDSTKTMYTSKDVMAGLPDLYEPKGPWQKGVAAAASAIPMSFGSRGMLGMGMGGAVAGEALTGAAPFKDDPDMARIIGNVLLPGASLGLGSVGPIVKYLAHKAGLGGVSHAADILAMGTGKAAADTGAAIDPQTLYEMGKSGQYTKDFLEKLAKRNIEKINPAWPVEPPGQAETWAKKLAEALLDFGARPAQQVNRGNLGE